METGRAAGKAENSAGGAGGSGEDVWLRRAVGQGVGGAAAAKRLAGRSLWAGEWSELARLGRAVGSGWARRTGECGVTDDVTDDVTF